VTALIKRGALGRLRWAIRQRRKPTSLAGRLRLWWADFILHPLFECSERCQDCGREYVLWSAPGDLYQEVHGSGFGLLCPGCFSAQADAKGIAVAFVAERWPLFEDRTD
jgi:hypothetical protein